MTRLWSETRWVQNPAPTGAKVALTPETPIAAGFWTQRVSDHSRVMVTSYCLDGAAAQQLAALGRKLAQACRHQNVAQAADGSWRFSTECNAGVWGNVATDGVAHGDFARHYTVEAQTQTAGAGRVNGGRRVLADISWQSACPRDMKPGDVVWPDGRRSRLADLPAPS